MKEKININTGQFRRLKAAAYNTQLTDGFFQMKYFYGRHEITRDDVLSDIRTTCSNESRKDSYMDCMNVLSLKCPAEYVQVAEYLRNKMNVFRDGIDVSEWIQKVVHDWFSDKLTCVRVLDEVFSECNEELVVQSRMHGPYISFAKASEIYPRITSEVFQCMQTKFILKPTPNDGCGSPWQDVLINFWLELLFTSSIFTNLSVQDAQDFLALARNVTRGEILNI
ncbi:uncharacterized protein LOC132755979 [Ruditapes philippinarum]|uniref:uncharacterized protein LOC132755979 n=1 Tax=Ruditapes philippinarum TaxID=129788 RepID=UPI00295BE5A3|nr:uncharacterized protein LOC132755979 [Ruditapes philippinarum]